jgi:hypothetical protein
MSEHTSKHSNEDTPAQPPDDGSPIDKVIEPIIESLPGAGRLHDGGGTEAPDIEGDLPGGDGGPGNDPVLPSGPAPAA